jgi:hypothetical protein
MSSYLSLIGSIIIGGIFLLSINRYHNSFNQNSDEKLLEVLTIQKSSAIIKLIEHDFNRMGFRIPTDVEHPNVRSIMLADTNRIHFLADSTVDTLKYYLSDTTLAIGTENPRDRILYRLVNNEPEVDAALGVTQFLIRYFDSNGSDVTDEIITYNDMITNLTDPNQLVQVKNQLADLLAQVRTFEITLMVEGTTGYDDQYSTFHWQTRITPPNISRY